MQIEDIMNHAKKLGHNLCSMKDVIIFEEQIIMLSEYSDNYADLDYEVYRLANKMDAIQKGVALSIQELTTLVLEIGDVSKAILSHIKPQRSNYLTEKEYLRGKAESYVYKNNYMPKKK